MLYGTLCRFPQQIWGPSGRLQVFSVLQRRSELFKIKGAGANRQLIGNKLSATRRLDGSILLRLEFDTSSRTSNLGSFPPQMALSAVRDLHLTSLGQAMDR